MIFLSPVKCSGERSGLLCTVSLAWASGSRDKCVVDQEIHHFCSRPVRVPVGWVVAAKALDLFLGLCCWMLAVDCEWEDAGGYSDGIWARTEPGQQEGAIRSSCLSCKGSLSVNSRAWEQLLESMEQAPIPLGNGLTYWCLCMCYGPDIVNHIHDPMFGACLPRWPWHSL